ncbi:unnamed protein product [Ectocarpus sp. 12 AP-2014]
MRFQLYKTEMCKKWQMATTADVKTRCRRTSAPTSSGPRISWMNAVCSGSCCMVARSATNGRETNRKPTRVTQRCCLKIPPAALQTWRWFRISQRCRPSWELTRGAQRLHKGHNCYSTPTTGTQGAIPTTGFVYGLARSDNDTYMHGGRERWRRPRRGLLGATVCRGVS